MLRRRSNLPKSSRPAAAFREYSSKFITCLLELSREVTPKCQHTRWTMSDFRNKEGRADSFPHIDLNKNRVLQFKCSFARYTWASSLSAKLYTSHASEFVLYKACDMRAHVLGNGDMSGPVIAFLDAQRCASTSDILLGSIESHNRISANTVRWSACTCISVMFACCRPMFSILYVAELFQVVINYRIGRFVPNSQRAIKPNGHIVPLLRNTACWLVKHAGQSQR